MRHTHQTPDNPPARRLIGIKSLVYITTLGMLIAACRAIQTSSTDLPAALTPSQATQATSSPLITSSPTTFPTNIPSLSPTSALSTTATATIPPDPLQFVYPTQGVLPVAGWRPPLYPTPWAPTLYDHFLFASPIAANEINTPVSDYRYGGVYFEDIVHTGIDIPAPIGTPILAAGDGTVTWAGYGLFQGGYDPTDPYGLAVNIQHDFGYQNQPLYTVYGHMSEVDVVQGQHVRTGQQLGLVGETGVVTGPHLHFEIRFGKDDFFATRNPELWLVPPIGYGIIAGRVMDGVGQLLYDQQITITDPQLEQNWFAWSYGKTTVNSDSYYQENLVIGDLPAGSYLFKMPIEVHAGMVNYFTFQGYWGFTAEPPPAPGANFTPIPIATAIP
jgi:murein DD-endopeptidase MepM/ murein hydrolase activator NlpD